MKKKINPVLKAIFEPLSLGHLKLRNRILMAPISTGLEYLNDFSDLKDFYVERAKGGVALITVGGFAINRLGGYYFNQPQFNRQRQVKKHLSMTSAIHAEGACVLFQLMHYGAMAKHFWPLNPDPIQKGNGTRKAHRIPNSLIQSTIQQYLETSLLAKSAGYDGVEIDIGGKRLLNSFATPGLNSREDQWGQTEARRHALALTIVQKIRQALGENFVISARLSLLDFHRYGKSWEETIRFAKELQACGVNCFTFDFGVGYMAIPVNHGLTPEDAWIPFIELFKKSITVPVVFGNNLSSPNVVNNVLENNPNSFVELSRPLIVDSGWVKKISYCLERNIIECSNCNQGCNISSIHKDHPLRCMMNPLIFQDAQKYFIRVKTPKNILVIGAGPSGLATAIFAARRGHKVTIYEEQNEIGGQILFCSKVPGKTKFISLIKLFKRLCSLYDVRIETAHKVSPDEFSDIRKEFDEVIFATGSRPTWVDIQGVPPNKIYQYQDIFSNPHLPVGKRVAVLGCNRIAIDTAIYLVHQNTETLNRDQWLESWGIGDPVKHIAGVVGVIPKVMVPHRQVSLLTRQHKSYTDNLMHDWKLFETRWLRIMGIKTYTHVKYQSYETDSLKILGENSQQEESIYADHIINCSEPIPNNVLAQTYAQMVGDVKTVGAAKKVSGNKNMKSILECVQEGIILGSQL